MYKSIKNLFNTDHPQHQQPNKGSSLITQKDNISKNNLHEVTNESLKVSNRIINRIKENYKKNSWKDVEQQKRKVFRTFLNAGTKTLKNYEKKLLDPLPENEGKNIIDNIIEIRSLFTLITSTNINKLKYTTEHYNDIYDNVFGNNKINTVKSIRIKKLLNSGLLGRFNLIDKAQTPLDDKAEIIGKANTLITYIFSNSKTENLNAAQNASLDIFLKNLYQTIKLITVGKDKIVGSEMQKQEQQKEINYASIWLNDLFHLDNTNEQITHFIIYGDHNDKIKKVNFDWRSANINKSPITTSTWIKDYKNLNYYNGNESKSDDYEDSDSDDDETHLLNN